MATIYIDPTVSGTGTGTFADPFKSWSSVTWTAGNYYLQKVGTTYTGAACSPGASGVAGAPIVIGTYEAGTGNQITDGRRFASVTNSGVTHIVGISSGRSWITIDNIEVVGSGRANSGSNENAIGVQTTGTGNITVRRCRIRDIPGTGIYFQSPLNAYPVGWLIEDNEIFNIGSAGAIWIGSGYGWAMRRNKVYDTGYKSAAFGLTCYPHRYVGTLTWSNTAGNVYEATLEDQAAETPLTYIEAVFFPGATSFNLKETTGTVSSPSSFEYGFDPATKKLYVNLNGEDPASKSAASVSYGRMRSWLIEENEIFDTHNLSIEGNAIQADDRASFGAIRRNLIYGRINHGIATNIGANNDIIGNICVVTSGNGIRCGNGRDNNIMHNTVVSTAPAHSVLYFETSNAGGAQEISNNILIGGTYGIQKAAGGGTNTSRTNCIFGQATAEATGITPTGTIAQNPLLDSRFAPQNTSLRTAGTMLKNQDFYGASFTPTPSIGAIQFFPDRSTVDRTTVDRTVVGRNTGRRAIAG